MLGNHTTQSSSRVVDRVVKVLDICTADSKNVTDFLLAKEVHNEVDHTE